VRGIDVERRFGFRGCIMVALGCLTLGLVPLLVLFAQRHFARRLDEFGIETRSGRRIAWNEFTSIKRAQSSLRTGVGGRVVGRSTFSDDLYSLPAHEFLSDEYLLESPKGRVSVPLHFWWVANGEALRAFTLTHLPPHLLSDVKRDLPSSAPGRGAWASLVFFMVVGALPIVSALQELHTQCELARSGVSGRARVTSHRIYILHSQQKPTTLYYLTVEYTPTKVGVPQRVERVVDQELYDQMVDGDAIDIRYLPDDRGTLMIVGHTHPDWAILAYYTPMYLAFFGLIGYLNWPGKRRASEAR
jgi:hypothetical protein